MINKNELRIGNWFEHGGNYKKVLALSYETIKVLDDNSVYYKDANPIPLTPEILLSCGYGGPLPKHIEFVHEFQNWYYWVHSKKEIEINL